MQELPFLDVTPPLWVFPVTLVVDAAGVVHGTQVNQVTLVVDASGVVHGTLEEPPATSESTEVIAEPEPEGEHEVENSCGSSTTSAGVSVSSVRKLHASTTRLRSSHRITSLQRALRP